jgi:hypothetical protein
MKAVVAVVSCLKIVPWRLLVRSEESDESWVEWFSYPKCETDSVGAELLSEHREDLERYMPH